MTSSFLCRICLRRSCLLSPCRSSNRDSTHRKRQATAGRRLNPTSCFVFLVAALFDARNLCVRTTACLGRGGVEANARVCLRLGELTFVCGVLSSSSRSQTSASNLGAMLPSLFVAVPLLLGAGGRGTGISGTIRSVQPRCRLSEYTSSNAAGGGTSADHVPSPSRWRQRTQRKRQRTEELLESISDGGLAPSLRRADDVGVPALAFPTIDWERHRAVDPMMPGKEVRGLRKRAQLEAFYHVITGILDSLYAEDEEGRDVKTTIIDAGCGAGNLAVSIAGLLADADSKYSRRSVRVLAVDTNKRALDRLSARSALLDLPPGMLRTCCADLADCESIRSRIEDYDDDNHRTVVVSLHACGAASDMASKSLPFCVFLLFTAPTRLTRITKTMQWSSPTRATTLHSCSARAARPSRSQRGFRTTAPTQTPRSSLIEKPRAMVSWL